MDIRETIGKLFEYEEMGLRRFSKETYAPSFEKFQEIAVEFDRELDRLYEESEDESAFCVQISEAFVAYIRENDNPELSRGKQEEVRRNHNLFMATYVLPHIMEMRNSYYKELAQAIEKSWSAAFKNSKIKAATYETVAGGFQRKLFGFSL
ncbi:MAG: hypothetical protein ACI4AA_10390 [Lachnospiraceae bacterium]